MKNHTPLLPDGVEFEFQTKLKSRPVDLVSVHQVHGTNLFCIEESTSANAAGTCRADGIISIQPLRIGVQTADCLPILLFAQGARRGVAAVHAGWRGLAAGIVGQSVQKLASVTHARPEDIFVAVGPSIRQCCFEVGPEVLKEFPSEFANGRYLALDQIARAKLITQHRIPISNIQIHPVCTYCGGGDWASFRRATHQKSETKERQWSWVRLKSV